MPINVSNKTLTTKTSATYSSQKPSLSNFKTTTPTKSTLTSSTSSSVVSSRTSISTIQQSSSPTLADILNTDLTSSTLSLLIKDITTIDITQKIKYTSKSSLDNSNTNSSIIKRNQTDDSVSETSIEHPKDETLTPLLIGLGVGIFVGLIIIGVIFWIRVRRRKFYTSRFEDELRPITRSGSNGSLNNGHYYQDEYHDNDEEEIESES